jgi:group I intron endonuclease
MPKQSTIEKYHIKEDEIKECMGRKGIIYKISSPSGKVYVGQTVRSFEERIRNHKCKSSGCTALKSAIDKYVDQMKYEIIEDNIPQEYLDEREIFWIKELNSLAPNGYNLSSGGNSNKECTRKLKSSIRDAKHKSVMEKNGYLGYVKQNRYLFYPVVKVYSKNFYLSYGGFYRKEEAIKVLKDYTEDPDNFTKVNGTAKKKTGCVFKVGNIWVLAYKGRYLGTYPTEEEAEEARKTLQSSTYTSSSEMA